jgi:hypothetical protein
MVATTKRLVAHNNNLGAEKDRVEAENAQLREHANTVETRLLAEIELLQEEISQKDAEINASKKLFASTRRQTIGYGTSWCSCCFAGSSLPGSCG